MARRRFSDLPLGVSGLLMVTSLVGCEKGFDGGRFNSREDEREGDVVASELWVLKRVEEGDGRDVVMDELDVEPG